MYVFFRSMQTGTYYFQQSHFGSRGQELWSGFWVVLTLTVRITIYTIICLKSVCLATFAQCSSQFWLNRVGRCLKLIASTLLCLVCLRRRTRSITNDRSPGWSVLRCCHGITQGQLGVVDDLVSPAEWWASSWAAP